MINGILFVEDGTIQPIGQITRLGDLIELIENVLPQLRQQDIIQKRQQLREQLSHADLEELERELEVRKKK